MGTGNKISHKIFEKAEKEFIFPDALIAEFNLLVSRYPEGQQKSALIPVLHIAQEECGGYLSVEVMDAVARYLQIQPVEVYEVATFYSQFYLEKKGKYILEVCRTSSCAVNGADDIMEHLEKKLNIKIGETTADGLFTLIGVECLGACGSAPVLQVNTEFRENMNIEKTDALIDELRTMAGEPKNNDEKWAKRFCLRK